MITLDLDHIFISGYKWQLCRGEQTGETSHSNNVSCAHVNSLDMVHIVTGGYRCCTGEHSGYINAFYQSALSECI